MSTPWVEIVDGRIDVDSPGDTGVITDIRNNLRHLKERADTVALHTLEAIHDNFTADALDTNTTPGAVDYPYVWDRGLGAGTMDITSTPGHYARFVPDANQWAVIAASKYRMHFDLDNDHQLFCEMRHKSNISDAGHTWLMGFQDSSLAVTAATSVTTQDNIIAFIQDASANKYKARCVKATVGVDVATALGNAANWTVLRIEVTFLGATKKVEFFVDGASVGTTTDTAKIPVVRLRPVFGFKSSGSVANSLLDSVDADWTIRPLSA